MQREDIFVGDPRGVANALRARPGAAPHVVHVLWHADRFSELPSRLVAAQLADVLESFEDLALIVIELIGDVPSVLRADPTVLADRVLRAGLTAELLLVGPTGEQGQQALSDLYERLGAGAPVREAIAELRVALTLTTEPSPALSLLTVPVYYQQHNGDRGLVRAVDRWPYAGPVRT